MDSELSYEDKGVRQKQHLSCGGSCLHSTSHEESTQTTNLREFLKAWQDPQWTHVTKTLHRSEANKIAVRAVRRVKERTAVAMTKLPFRSMV